MQVPAVLRETAKERFFLVGSYLNENEREKIASFLRKNIDIFAWQPYDMLSIDAEVMCYRLHIDKNFKPIKQKPIRATPKKS